MSGASTTPAPSWEGIRTPVPLNEPMSLGGLLAGAFLSIVTLGIFLVIALWDWYSRADRIDREGIVCHRGVLRWSELEHAEVVTRHGGRVGHPTSVSFYEMRFATQTVTIGPWGAPDPELVLRALSAGVGKPVVVPRPRGLD